MYPAGAIFLFPDELVKAAMLLDVEEVCTALLWVGDADVCSFAPEVLGVGCSTDYGVDPLVAQSTGNVDGFTEVIAQGLEHGAAEVCQVQGVL